MTTVHEVLQNYPKILERLDRLEKQTFGGTANEDYENLSPRKQAKRISQGKDNEHHIGKKTKEVLVQEAISLINEQNPDTWSPKEAKEFMEKIRELEKEIQSHPDRKWIEMQLEKNSVAIERLRKKFEELME